MEIYYERASHTEISVIFVPEITDVVPSQSVFDELWESRQRAKRERKEKKEEAPPAVHCL
jgi:hypothetical protein